MKTEFVTLNNVPVRVDSLGGYLPSKILEDPNNKPSELILVVPGNPGITKFYDKFIYELHERTKKPVWLVSHGGHDKTNKKFPKLESNKNLYNLQGQTKQKKELIKTYLEGVKLYCVGHSIGCKMLLDLLKEEEITEIENCNFLFPTLERMAETKNGGKVLFVSRYILSLMLFGSWIFVYLPRIIQLVLLRIAFLFLRIPPGNVGAVLELIEPHVLNKVFFLAHNEMKEVRELDHETIDKNITKLRLYYGATDGWTPLRYYEELKQKHRGIKAEVCSRGYDHAFVLRNSIEVAVLVSDWLKTNC